MQAALNGRDFSVLQTRTRDGIVLEPLYPRAREPVPVPGRGGEPWRVVQSIDEPDPDLANLQAFEAIKGGATGLALRFASGQSAFPALPLTKDALYTVLEGVDLAAVHIRIEPCAGSVELAGWLRALLAASGLAGERAKIGFGLDVLGGSDQPPAQDLGPRVACCAELRRAGISGPLAELDARPVHEAGGTEAQELAAVLASATWWVRALEAAGLQAEAALPCFGASLSVDRDQWLTIAKLRALRLLWARLLELCRVPHLRLPVHAETSRRMMARVDPHSNILRTTIAAFAAGVGGADSITVLPFTAALGSQNSHARALARNTQHLLLEESQLHRAADPAAGSGAVEALTKALAESAWGEFQALEREGGLVESLRAGAFQARIAAARELLQADLVAGKAPLVGSTIYWAGDPEPASDDDQSSGTSPTRIAPVRLETLARGV